MDKALGGPPVLRLLTSLNVVSQVNEDEVILG